MIDAILDGSILSAPTATVPHFNLKVPTALPGVDSDLLDPRNCYADKSEWDAKAKKLTQAFQKNFAKFMSNEACAELAKTGGPQED